MSEARCSGYCDSCMQPCETYQADIRWDYQTGHLAGAAVAFGLMGMAEAIRGRTWQCSHNLANDPDHPEGLNGCRGQTFYHPDNPYEPCWMCGSEG